MLGRGPDVWHPSPEQLFQDGVGPLLDVGPYYLTAIVTLLGPVRAVAGFASTTTRERPISIGPRAGRRCVGGTPRRAATAASPRRDARSQPRRRGARWRSPPARSARTPCPSCAPLRPSSRAPRRDRFAASKSPCCLNSREFRTHLWKQRLFTSAFRG